MSSFSPQLPIIRRHLVRSGCVAAVLVLAGGCDSGNRGGALTETGVRHPPWQVGAGQERLPAANPLLATLPTARTGAGLISIGGEERRAVAFGMGSSMTLEFIAAVDEGLYLHHGKVAGDDISVVLRVVAHRGEGSGATVATVSPGSSWGYVSFPALAEGRYTIELTAESTDPSAVAAITEPIVARREDL